MDEVEARPVLWYVALEQQLLSQLYTHAWINHFGVPQAVDHDDHVVVEFTESLAADVKGLLKNRKEGSGRKTRVQLNRSAHLKNFTDVCCAD